MRYGQPWKTTREKYRLMGDNEWRPWFAWRPVRLEDGTWAWRETVERHQAMAYDVPRYRLGPLLPEKPPLSPNRSAW